MNGLSNSLITEIKEVMQNARQNVARQVNSELLTAYWNIGRIIVEHEQDSKTRADYGAQTLRELSKALTSEFGRGFSVSNIQFMRRFYQTYQIQQTVSVKLTSGRIIANCFLFPTKVSAVFMKRNRKTPSGRFGN